MKDTRRRRGPLSTIKALACFACSVIVGVANIWAALTTTMTTVGSALLDNAALLTSRSLLRRDADGADAITPATTRSGTSIPHLLHFVWVSMAIQTENNTLSDMAQGAVASWRELYPDWKILVWDNHKVRHYYPSTVQTTLTKCDNTAHMSDVLRYAILDDMGGVYLDADTYAVHRLPDWLLRRGAFTVCQDPFSVPLEGESIIIHDCNQTANGFIGAEPHHQAVRGILAKAIDAVRNRDPTATPNIDRRFGVDVSFFVRSGPIGWTEEAIKYGVTILHSHSFFPCKWSKLKSDCVVERFRNDSRVVGMHKGAASWLPRAKPKVGKITRGAKNQRHIFVGR